MSKRARDTAKDRGQSRRRVQAKTTPRDESEGESDEKKLDKMSERELRERLVYIPSPVLQSMIVALASGREQDATSVWEEVRARTADECFPYFSEARRWIEELAAPSLYQLVSPSQFKKFNISRQTKRLAKSRAAVLEAVDRHPAYFFDAAVRLKYSLHKEELLTKRAFRCWRAMPIDHYLHLRIFKNREQVPGDYEFESYIVQLVSRKAILEKNAFVVHLVLRACFQTEAYSPLAWELFHPGTAAWSPHFTFPLKISQMSAEDRLRDRWVRDTEFTGSRCDASAGVCVHPRRCDYSSKSQWKISLNPSLGTLLETGRQSGALVRSLVDRALGRVAVLSDLALSYLDPEDFGRCSPWLPLQMQLERHSAQGDGTILFDRLMPAACKWSPFLNAQAPQLASEKAEIYSAFGEAPRLAKIGLTTDDLNESEGALDASDASDWDVYCDDSNSDDSD